MVTNKVHHFAIGLVFLFAALSFFYAPPILQLCAALLAVIFLVSSINTKPPEPLQIIPQYHTCNAILKTGKRVSVSFTIHCPSNGAPDAIRFHIPKSIIDETTSYLSSLDHLPPKLDVEYHLVLFARRIALIHDLSTLNVVITNIMEIDQSQPGVFIGTEM